MKAYYVFPLIIAIESVCASAAYAYSGMWVKAIYWLSASIITISIILM